MMLEILRAAGFTEGEAKVYLALLETGTTTVGPIAKKASVSYSKIHILLDKLTEKGLASHITKENARYFSASSPKKLLDYLERKRQAVDKERADIERVMPQLEGMRKSTQLLEQAEVFEGYEGLKSVYLDGLEQLAEKDEILVMGASLGAYTDKRTYGAFFEQINRLRLKKKIRYRLIYNTSFKGESGVRYWQEQPLTAVRFLMDNTPGSVNIQGNRVLIIYWAQGSPKIFVITSAVVADSFRTYFEAIWTAAKK